MTYTVVWIGTPFTRIETEFDTRPEAEAFAKGVLTLYIIERGQNKERKLAKIERAIARRKLTRGE
jgi:hypothetical protein